MGGRCFADQSEGRLLKTRPLSCGCLGKGCCPDLGRLNPRGMGAAALLLLLSGGESWFLLWDPGVISPVSAQGCRSDVICASQSRKVRQGRQSRGNEDVTDKGWQVLVHKRVEGRFYKFHVEYRATSHGARGLHQKGTHLNLGSHIG